ncbi:hypothetical protein ACQ1RB_03480, partial [Ornithobacterium rhinotracheale]
MARTFVYNAGAPKKSIEDIHLQVGMFFDGTANNRTNTMIRKKYYQIEEGKGIDKIKKSITSIDIDSIACKMESFIEGLKEVYEDGNIPECTSSN